MGKRTIKMILRNAELIEYGIQSEQTDLRAHVCVNAEKVYVYPTRAGVEAIETGEFRKATASQPGATFTTAEGFLVPPGAIPGCVPVLAKFAMDAAGPIRYSDSTTYKGEWAVKVVQILLEDGRFPMSGSSKVIDDPIMQRQGVDLVIAFNSRIQIKCDYDGGGPRRKGEPGNRVTGNLFIQVSECNPFHRQ